MVVLMFTQVLMELWHFLTSQLKEQFPENFKILKFKCQVLIILKIVKDNFPELFSVPFSDLPFPYPVRGLTEHSLV